jgi:hypothetical protein
LRRRGIDVVIGAQSQRVGSPVLRDRPAGAILLWQRPHQPHGMTGEQDRQDPKVLLRRPVTVEARDQEHRAERFQVVTTILDASLDGAQIGDLYERRWQGEVEIRSIQSVRHMDILRGKPPARVRKEIWAHRLAYNLLRTVRAVAAGANGREPRPVSFQGAQQAVTALAPQLEAARPKDRPAWLAALLAVIADHRVGARPGRWEPRARQRRPKPGARLGQPRAAAKLPKHRWKWSESASRWDGAGAGRQTRDRSQLKTKETCSGGPQGRRNKARRARPGRGRPAPCGCTLTGWRRVSGGPSGRWDWG